MKQYFYQPERDRDYTIRVTSESGYSDADEKGGIEILRRAI